MSVWMDERRNEWMNEQRGKHMDGWANIWISIWWQVLEGIAMIRKHSRHKWVILFSKDSSVSEGQWGGNLLSHFFDLHIQQFHSYVALLGSLIFSHFCWVFLNIYIFCFVVVVVVSPSAMTLTFWRL